MRSAITGAWSTRILRVLVRVLVRVLAPRESAPECPGGPICGYCGYLLWAPTRVPREKKGGMRECARYPSSFSPRGGAEAGKKYPQYPQYPQTGPGGTERGSAETPALRGQVWKYPQDASKYPHAGAGGDAMRGGMDPSTAWPSPPPAALLLGAVGCGSRPEAPERAGGRPPRGASSSRPARQEEPR